MGCVTDIPGIKTFPPGSKGFEPPTQDQVLWHIPQHTHMAQPLSCHAEVSGVPQPQGPPVTQ